jgi:exosortase
MIQHRFGAWGVRSAVVLPLGGLYVPTLVEMAHEWQTNQYAGHGPFVPLFSALLLWMDRHRLHASAEASRPVLGHPAGLPVILTGLGLLGLGTWAHAILVQGLSAAVTVAGLILWAFGPECLRVAAFPVGFLVLMVPLPYAVVDAVTLDIQRFAAGSAAAVLRVVGIPVYQNGVVIELPVMTLQVAQACNGLRFLMALVVLTTAFAQVTQRTVLRKAVLIGAAVPIAVVANAFRVAVVAVGVQVVGPQAASGTIHNWIGHVVWALTLIPLVLLAFLLWRGGDRTLPTAGAEGHLERREGIA